MKFRSLIGIGITEDIPIYNVRYIKVVNIMSWLTMSIAMVIGSALLFFTGGNYLVGLIYLAAVLFGGCLYLNKIGYYNWSRHIIITVVPIGLVLLSVAAMAINPAAISPQSYFIGRTILLSSSIAPLLIFSVKEIKSIVFGILLAAVIILFFAQIHDLFGLGFARLFNLPEQTHFFADVLSVIVFFVTSGYLLYFKFITKDVLIENKNVINHLSVSNSKMSHQLDEKNRRLKESNHVLMRYNSNLEQYSITISHNLRGPVANLLGLANLFEYEQDEQEKKELIGHIKRTASALDGVLKDLSKIIDVRNNQFQIKENVSISEEFAKIHELFHGSLKEKNAVLNSNLEYDTIYCVRSYLNSILYNLISNAIKYGDHKRLNNIRVSSYLDGEELIIEVSDTGVGLDVEKYSESMFGIYKRFHEHVDGKGLGLYLAKQQVEAIGGRISVESKLGEGTTFIINCPNQKIDEISEQLYYESDAACVWYDAINYSATLIWKKRPSSSEYREGLIRLKQLANNYKCKIWFNDVRKLGFVRQEDHKWFINNLIMGAPALSIERIIVVRDKHNGDDEEYYRTIREVAAKRSIVVNYQLCSMKEAWQEMEEIELA